MEYGKDGSNEVGKREVITRERGCSKRLNFRLTAQEDAIFREHVAAANMSATEYFLRECVYGGMPGYAAPDWGELRAAREEIERQGNNLNQIAHAANSLNLALGVDAGIMSPRQITRLANGLTDAMRLADEERRKYADAINRIYRAAHLNRKGL